MRPFVLAFFLMLVAASAGWAQSCNTARLPPPVPLFSGTSPPAIPTAHSGLPPLPGSCDTLLNGLVGWWKFDEGSGTSTSDSSGGGNTGTLVNGPVWVAGHIGSGALQFDGATNYVTAGSPLPHVIVDYTESAWINTDPSLNDHSGSTAMNINDMWLGFGYQSSKWDCNVNSYVESVQDITSGWHLLTCVYDHTSSRMTMYLDGSYENSGSGVGPPNNGDGSINIGFYGFQYGGQWFNGMIDDARVYNRALSAAEVQALYNWTGP